MSDTERNLQTIQTIYAAFARGDVPAILELCSEDAVFGFEGGSPLVPWHGPWRGRAEIARFFETIGKAVEFQAFEPRHFLASTSEVAVLLRLRYVVAATRNVVDEQQVHWWSLQSGKVKALCHHEDTAQVIAAVQPAR